MINKKGIELSVNFIVMLVITLIVFGGTLAIAMKVLKGADKLKQGLDKQTEERLNALLNSGTDEVVIAQNNKEVELGDSVTFGIGVLNNLGSEKKFNVTIYKSIALNKDGTELINPNWDTGWVYFNNAEIGTIKNNEHTNYAINIIPSKNANSGYTYVFDVKSYPGSNGVAIYYPQTNPVRKIRITIV